MKLFIISSVIFLINQVLQYFDLGTTFSTSYLDDLLFFPITLSIIGLFEKFRNDSYQIPIKHTLLGLVIVSLLFELIIPKIDSRFTADYIDIIYYFIGATLYHLTITIKNPRLNKV